MIPGFVPNDCRDLLEKMIKVDPDERPTVILLTFLYSARIR